MSVRSKILLYDRDGNLLMPLHNQMPRCWTLFGGVCEHDESPEKTAMRELTEESCGFFNETNITLEPWVEVKYERYNPNTGRSKKITYHMFTGIFSGEMPDTLHFKPEDCRALGYRYEIKFTKKLKRDSLTDLLRGESVGGYTLWNDDRSILLMTKP